MISIFTRRSTLFLVFSLYAAGCEDTGLNPGMSPFPGFPDNNNTADSGSPTPGDGDGDGDGGGDGDGDNHGNGDGDGDPGPILPGDGDGDGGGDGDGDGGTIPDPDPDPDPDPENPGGTCCSDGDCVCRGDAPTEASASANGPYKYESYSRGFRDGPRFGGGTIYYPVDAEPPFSGLVMCPGFTARQSSIAAWGPFFASHGIVFMTIDTNTTGDQVNVRDDALLDALQSLREENQRQGSPLFGKLSADRYGLSGWSMGGGGTWLAAAATPTLKTAMSLAGHHVTAGGARVANGTTVPSIMFAGATDPGILGGGGQSQGVYEIIPETTPKILYEMRSEGHFSWGTPRTNSGALGRYALAFQKLFLEGDERYTPLLLKEGPGASDWRSNLPDLGY